MISNVYERKLDEFKNNYIDGSREKMEEIRKKNELTNQEYLDLFVFDCRIDKEDFKVSDYGKMSHEEKFEFLKGKDEELDQKVFNYIASKEKKKIICATFEALDVDEMKVKLITWNTPMVAEHEKIFEGCFIVVDATINEEGKFLLSHETKINMPVKCNEALYKNFLRKKESIDDIEVNQKFDIIAKYVSREFCKENWKIIIEVKDGKNENFCIELEEDSTCFDKFMKQGNELFIKNIIWHGRLNRQGMAIVETIADESTICCIE